MYGAWTRSSTRTCSGSSRAPRGAAVGCGLVPVLGGGSTHGNQALALAVGRLARKSSSTGPCQVAAARAGPGRAAAGVGAAEMDPASGLPPAVAVESVRAALAAHPDACECSSAIRPMWGRSATWPGTRRSARGRGSADRGRRLGGALGFHPDLPPHAIAVGADAMVTSAHKALPAYTQGALVLASTERLDPARLDRAFEATHTTSPAGRSWPASTRPGRCWPGTASELCARLIQRRRGGTAAAAQVPGSPCSTVPAWSQPSWSCCWPGPARTGKGGSGPDRGRDAGGDGRSRHGRADLAIADDEEHIARFTDALTASIERHRGAPRQPSRQPHGRSSRRPYSRRGRRSSPRTRPCRRRGGRPGQRRAGRALSPGVPVLAPGELITSQALAALREVQADGGRIAFAADPTLATLQVICA